MKCDEAGRLVEATVVDHVIPIRARPDLRLTLSNLQALCKPCHDRKTALEDGAFGRAPSHGPGEGGRKSGRAAPRDRVPK